MTEKKFIEQNIEKWRELEDLLSKSEQNPEKLHSLFVKVSSDLSYARTFFPNRSVRLYLNNLTQSVFDTLGKKKNKFSLEPVKRFFGHILPLEIYRSRKAFYVSTIIFLMSLGIGILSTSYNPDFATVILGEGYISMTEDNINAGDPMRVYKSEGQIDMFFGITLNNLRVDAIAFVLGIFGGIGTIFVLISNGIMVGAFQWYFYTKGLFLTSFLTIWCHGTIEIPTIIISSAAGIILGNGLLFPGTYKRSTSLQISAVRALRILMGVIPLTIIAGVLESFVTRLTDMPMGAKIFIIVASLAFVLFMWVFYPWYYFRKMGGEITDVEIIPFADNPIKEAKMSYRRFEDNVSLSIIHYKNNIGSIFKYLGFPILMIGSFLIWFTLRSVDALSFLEVYNLFYYNQSNLLLFFFLLIAVASFTIYLSYSYLDNDGDGILVHIKRNFLAILLITFSIVFPIYFIAQGWVIFILFLFVAPHFYVIFSLRFDRDRNLGFVKNFTQSFKESFRFYLNFLPQYLISAFFFFAVYLVFRITGVGSIIQELLMWHELFESNIIAVSFYNHFTMILTFIITAPFFYYAIADNYYSLLCQKYGYDLESRFENFGKSSLIFETT